MATSLLFHSSINIWIQWQEERHTRKCECKKAFYWSAFPWNSHGNPLAYVPPRVQLRTPVALRSCHWLQIYHPGKDLVLKRGMSHKNVQQARQQPELSSLLGASGSCLLSPFLNAFKIASAEPEFINTFTPCVPMENIKKDIRESSVKCAAT